MNNLKNSVTLIGNLGRDPEVKKLPSGSSLARFSLATHEKHKNDKGELVDKTEWHNCVGWGKTAELMEQLLKKGKEIAVRGKLTYNNYQDKEGNPRSIAEVIVDEFVLFGKP